MLPGSVSGILTKGSGREANTVCHTISEAADLAVPESGRQSCRRPTSDPSELQTEPSRGPLLQEAARAMREEGEDEDRRVKKEKKRGDYGARRWLHLLSRPGRLLHRS